MSDDKLYKRILWIDDLDKDLDEEELCNLALSDSIKPIRTFEKAIEEIISPDFIYDTVILDIDLPAPKNL